MDNLLLKYTDRNNLPRDVDQLMDIVVMLATALRETQAELRKTQILLSQTQEELKEAREEIATLKRHIFGKKSEQTKKESNTEDTKTCNRNKNHKGRQPLPKHLDRVRIEHDLKPEDKICPYCNGTLNKISEVITEHLDIVPLKFFARQHARFKYACNCGNTIKLADMPGQPIEKGSVVPEIHAYIMVSKYQDGLPLYRIQRQFKRHGINVKSSTLCTWVQQASRELEPLCDAMKEEVVSGDHVFSDDTTMPTLAPGTGKTKTGRIWTYISKANDGITTYTYTSDRKGQHPQEVLKDFTGFLQADRYAGYNQLTKQNADKSNVCKIAACWAHARRKYVEVVECNPKSIATEALEMVNSLYSIEKFIKEQEMGDEKRCLYRLEKSVPILSNLHNWLNEHKDKVTPTSALGKAIAYNLNGWGNFLTFLQDGRLEIDNNRAERAMKPVVIGRKNFLFVGSEEGGKSAAILYSLLETCRQNDINGHEYLADVLTKIPTHPNKRIQELLPHHWKPPQQLEAFA